MSYCNYNIVVVACKNNHGSCKTGWLWLAICFNPNGIFVGVGEVTGLGTKWVLIPGLPVLFVCSAAMFSRVGVQNGGTMGWSSMVSCGLDRHGMWQLFSFDVIWPESWIGLRKCWFWDIYVLNHTFLYSIDNVVAIQLLWPYGPSFIFGILSDYFCTNYKIF